jgi:hypothetical protein
MALSKFVMCLDLCRSARTIRSRVLPAPGYDPRPQARSGERGPAMMTMDNAAVFPITGLQIILNIRSR